MLSHAQQTMLDLCSYRLSSTNTGRHPKVNCPWHEESSPSLTLYDNGYHCFGCGANGSAADFVRKIKYGHLDSREGYASAYKDLGLSAPPQRSVLRTVNEFQHWRDTAHNHETKTLTAEQITVLTLAWRWYHDTLHEKKSIVGTAYAEQRGVQDTYEVGLCLEDGLFLDTLMDQKLIDPALEIGLIGQRRNPQPGQGTYHQKMRGCLVLCEIESPSGRCIWMTGRAIPTLVPDELLKKRKYMNLSIPTVLFGAQEIDRQRGYNRHLLPVLVVEGQMCVLALRRLGIDAVALGGKILTPRLAPWFQGRRVIPCLDAPRSKDELRDLVLANQKLADTVAPYALIVEQPLDMASTGKKDPAEYIEAHGEFNL